jgi:hypothetical protein
MPLRTTHVVVVLFALLTVGLFVPSAAAVSGELRVLYALTTWGPMPFTHAEAERVAAETDSFYRASSSGRFSMPGSVVGPIRLPRSVFDSCDARALRNEAPASTLAGYDRIVFVTPPVQACQFHGLAGRTEALLNGQLHAPLAIHELGHTLGLAHASGWHCIALGCTIAEYGNVFSVMGEGGGDFNAYEKAQLGWLTGLVTPSGNATYEIGSIEGSTTLPQALVVATAGTEFWFESRGRPTPSFLGESEQPAGVPVIAGPSTGSRASPYPRGNLLLPHPSGRARFAYTTGESFVQPEVFTVVVERHAPESATLRFEWLDRVAPAAPPLRVRATQRGRVQLSWDRARERGSGVKTYTVLADGRTVRAVGEETPYLNSSAILRLAAGSHRVGVFATDRAGNRGPTTSVRVRVK